jgi:hypothetical protein
MIYHYSAKELASCKRLNKTSSTLCCLNSRKHASSVAELQLKVGKIDAYWIRARPRSSSPMNVRGRNAVLGVHTK